MVYANVSDVTARMTRELSEAELALCGKLLEDAAVLIDACRAAAPLDAKRLVSCRMVIRALGDGETGGYPMGATQGSMTALGYTQSWTMGGGGSNGELYIGKTERTLLGAGNSLGAFNPLERLVWPRPIRPEDCCHD